RVRWVGGRLQAHILLLSRNSVLSCASIAVEARPDHTGVSCFGDEALDRSPRWHRGLTPRERPLYFAGFMTAASGRLASAPVAELVDALDSKSSSARSAGSIPARGTNLRIASHRRSSPSFRNAPLSTDLFLVIPGCAAPPSSFRGAPLASPSSFRGAREREPGIHWAATIAVGWIPGSRQERGAPRNDGGGMCVRIPAARCALVIPGSRGAPRNDEKRDLR